MKRTEVIDVEHHFTVEEYAERAKNMARIQKDIEDLATEKEKNAASFNAQIKDKDKALSEIGREVRLGFVVAPTECDVVLNVPELGQKSYFRPGQPDIILKSVPMTAKDRQKHIFLDEPDPGTSSKGAHA